MLVEARTKSTCKSQKSSYKWVQPRTSLANSVASRMIKVAACTNGTVVVRGVKTTTRGFSQPNLQDLLGLTLSLLCRISDLAKSHKSP